MATTCLIINEIKRLTLSWSKIEDRRIEKDFSVIAFFPLSLFAACFSNGFWKFCTGMWSFRVEEEKRVVDSKKDCRCSWYSELLLIVEFLCVLPIKIVHKTKSIYRCWRVIVWLNLMLIHEYYPVEKLNKMFARMKNSRVFR